MTTPDQIAQASRAAARGLIGLRERDGHWQDYALPVGVSDAWVTGYAAFALAEAGEPAAADLAADWLLAHRYPDGGWGFNGLTGPDADSTAWAIRLLTTLHRPVKREDLAILRSFRRDDGGFATYHEPAWWGRSQPDVTAAVLLALPRERLHDDADAALRYLASTRLPDGTWPAYWWRTGHYATALCIELLDRLGRLDDRALPVVTMEEPQAIHSAFDLACVAQALGTVAGSELAGPVLRELIALQDANGRWPGGANLRVTDPDCAAPWSEPRGRLYIDGRGVITTATALRALTRARKRPNRISLAGVTEGAGW